MSTGVVLLAAGSGRRFGQSRPKQLSRLQGEPLFLQSFRVFARTPSVKEIVLVVPPGKKNSYRRLTHTPKGKTVCVVSGGRFRGESVKNGVKALSDKSRIILVHDTARPLVSMSVVKRVEQAAKKFGVSLAAWPLADTLKKSHKKNFVQKTIPRESLWCAQTPQGFKRHIALSCLLKPMKNITDDVALAEKKGYPVKLVVGEAKNFKVTYPYDYHVCQALLKSKPKKRR